MLERLACNLGCNDEVPNIELAEDIVKRNDAAAVLEIVEGFKGSNKAVASDCIKVLYEVGERNPALISPFPDVFIACLRSRNNRLVWGGMKALATIVELAPESIFKKLPVIMSAYEEGSVITVDNSISVFAGLCHASEDYAETILPILLRHLRECRPKEVAQHAERASICFNSTNSADFAAILENRLSHLAPPQATRVKRLLKKLHSLR